MSDPIEEFQGSADFKRLKELWDAAVVPINPPPAEDVGQALAFGLNFRVHVVKALQAAWETAHVAIKTIAAAHVPFDPVTWLEISAEIFGAAHTIFSSLVQRMSPIDYISCVVLSAHPEGMTDIELQNAVKSFLDDPNQDQFSWYLRVSDDTIARAKAVLGGKNWFPELLESLRDAKFLDEDQEKLKFHPRNYTVDWKED
jgi:hypothetical protein